MNQNEKILIGLSACLAGESVRYDGGHKKNELILQKLAEHFNFQTFCPEVLIGLGVPRDPIHLRIMIGGIRAVHTEDKTRDYTEALQASAQSMGPLNGFIFKARSPSCAIMTAPLHDEKGEELEGKFSSGVFVAQLQKYFPGLPIIDEEEILNVDSRKEFIRKVEVYSSFV